MKQVGVFLGSVDISGDETDGQCLNEVLTKVWMNSNCCGVFKGSVDKSVDE